VPCTDEKLISFWNAVQQHQNILKVEEVWTLQNDISWIGGIRKLFVRDIYKQYANEILFLNDSGVKVERCLITGLKGVGKSVFLNYLIARIVEKDSPAIPSIQICSCCTSS
jgi:predicted AAA+ superfamily ATPase